MGTESDGISCQVNNEVMGRWHYIKSAREDLIKRAVERIRFNEYSETVGKRVMEVVG